VEVLRRQATVVERLAPAKPTTVPNLIRLFLSAAERQWAPWRPGQPRLAFGCGVVNAATLSGANLASADLSGADLTDARVDAPISPTPI
jgi:hypothetical protein